MFEWYWFFLFYLVTFHISSVVFSLYVHRTIGHGLFKISKPLEYIFRLILWLGGNLGPRWAETYAARHRKHHRTSDTSADPHSPYHMSLKEMCNSWHMDPDDVKKYCPEISTPNDWIQRVLYEKYQFLGPWVLHIVALVLFGPIGFAVSIALKLATRKWLGVFLGNFATHKIGFTYAGNRFAGDQSKNIFPLGILLGGEELHANHHNHPRSSNFKKRWFEIDTGYIYAMILSKFRLLTIISQQPNTNL